MVEHPEKAEVGLKGLVQSVLTDHGCHTMTDGVITPPCPVCDARELGLEDIPGAQICE